MGIIESNVKKAFDQFKKDGCLYKFIHKLLCDADYSVRYAHQMSSVLDALKKHCPATLFECIWYNGETGQYELLDFNPNNIKPKTIIKKAWELLQQTYSFEESEKEKVLETLYLLPTNLLIRLEQE